MVYNGYKQLVNRFHAGISRLGLVIFPATCVLCGGDGAFGLDLCLPCQNDLPWIRRACTGCGLPLEGVSGTSGLVQGSHSTLCGICIREPRNFERGYAPFIYAEPADWLVQQLKFNSRLPCIRVLSHLLLQYLLQQEVEIPEAIIPVPLHAERYRQRGFNQALELARPIARAMNRPIINDICLRQQNTVPQLDLPAKKRAANVRNAFKIIKPMTAKHIAIVDDVMTTGATTNELARLLKRNGAEFVQVWTVARTVAD